MTQPAAFSDYDELLAFENRVFGVDFLSVVPKLYRDPALCAERHSVIKDNEKITAAIAAWPTAIESDCGSLRGLGVGSVAVDVSARGKGYMKGLMAACERAAEETEADFAFLSGSRGRYEHYGFRPCGHRFLFELTPYVARHFRGNTSYSFVPLAEDKEGESAAYDLFQSQPLHWARSREAFSLDLGTWGAESFAVRDAAGTFCGYLVFERRRAFISEFLLRDWSRTEAVLVAFANQADAGTLTVAASPTQIELLNALYSFGEGIVTQMPAAFKIYHFRRFLEVLGSFRAKHFAIPEGALVLKIGGETLRVTVKDGRCTAEPTDETPEFIFDEKEAAVRLTTTFGQMVSHPLFAAWAPLCPFDMPHPDGV